MKNTILFNVVCILSVLMFSCGSKTTLIKRQYNKGYYFAHVQNKHKAFTGKKENHLTQQKTKTTITDSITKGVDPILIGSQKTDNFVLEANTSKKPIVFNTHIVAKHPLKSWPTFHTYRVKENENSSIRNKKMGAVSHTDGGLSLFWVIILVLLILWALGFWGAWFGLGGIIHILLLIALILLILWLLRIL